MPIKDFSNQAPTSLPGKNIQAILEGSRAITMSPSELLLTNASSTSSFLYDPPTLGLKSTQQLNTDWSKFENHTFFSSAEVNVNVAFDQIINNFPFDGSKKEVEVFFEKLTGFEKYVYDQFPKNKGYLFFSGTQPGEDTNGSKGTWIQVIDYAGSQFPNLSKNTTGQPILNPQLNSFSLEFQLFVPSISNNLSMVCQKQASQTQGFSLFLQQSASTSTCNIQFVICSGSISLNAVAPLSKGVFNHVCAVYNRESSANRLEIYINEQLVSTSASSFAFQPLAISSVPLLIATGSAVTFNGSTSTPTTTLSGAIDEFRFFHSARTLLQQKLYAQKAIFATSDLKLYFKFNEPFGVIGSSANDQINSITIDSSGNSLHSFISNYKSSLRNTGSIAVPMIYEKTSLSPVLFPNFTNVSILNANLLASASIYDDSNPNIITKLIPPHYFLEGQSYEGLTSEGGTIGDGYSGTSPKNGQLGTTQLLLTFLYTWAKFFDEIKQFIDAFSTLNYVDYNSKGTIPDHFLPTLMKQFGFQLPPFFLDASIEQYIDAENIQSQVSTDAYSLQYVQNQILRRVLSNMNEIIKSKGTQHSIKAFLRSVGIDPENSFRIREFGGPTERQLKSARETKSEPNYMLDFSSNGYFVSSFLSSSRIELGFPAAQGPFINKSTTLPHGISTNVSDGLLTSGSFTFEGLYSFPLYKGVSNVTQSLMRMFVSGSGSTSQFCTFNLLALSGTATTPPSIKLYARPTIGSTLALAPLATLVMTGCNIFDGNLWNVSWGRIRSDQVGTSVSSSLFIRAARQNAGEIKESWTTSSYFLLEGISPVFSSTLSNISTTSNAFGSYFVVGNQPFTSSGNFLNNTSLVQSEARATNFCGQLARIKFWSKAIDSIEWKEHIINPKSLGTRNPLQNFSFNVKETGSWERLRVDLTLDQTNQTSDSTGKLQFFDFSQNNFHASGFGFPSSTNLFSNSIWTYGFISPAFDEAVCNDKIRIRSFQNYKNVLESDYAEVAPLYSLNPSESPTDDTRFSIEFSLIDALNRDIINIFATLESIENAIGNPELIFSPDYPSLEAMRTMYFNRLTDKINVKAFFEFFRWFETSIGNFIEQLIPKKTKFFGTNFVVESHMLERHKLEYNSSDIYLTEQTLSPTRDVLLLQQIEGSIVKF